MRKVLMAVGLTLLLVTPGVVAQEADDDDYVTTTTEAVEGTQEERQFGEFVAGESFTKEDCGFQAGSTVDLELNNNIDAGTDSVGSDGCARMTVAILSGQRVSIDGRVYQGHCGSNRIDVMGTGANGADRTVVNQFRISCAGGRGAVARTGAMIARWSAAGVALLLVGAFLVVRDRRRKATTTL